MRTIASLVMAWWDVSLQYLISIGNNQGSKNMAQGEDKNKNRKWDFLYEKKVVYNSALVDAWFQNRLGKNNQLLTISYLAVGLLIFSIEFLQSDNLYVLVGMFVLWSFAFISFTLCGILTLFILRDNPAYLEAVINEEKKHEELSRLLKRKENISFRLFFWGVVFICLLSLLVARDSFYSSYGEVCDMGGKKTILSSEKGDPKPADNFSSGVTAIDPDKSKSIPPAASPPTETPPPPTTKGGK